jgi:hypothetical protein
MHFLVHFLDAGDNPQEKINWKQENTTISLELFSVVFLTSFKIAST